MWFYCLMYLSTYAAVIKVSIMGLVYILLLKHCYIAIKFPVMSTHSKFFNAYLFIYLVATFPF